MIQRLSYRGLEIACSCSNSSKVFYLLVPQGLNTDILEWEATASQAYGCSIVVISGMDWNRDMTPWRAPGMFKKEKAFEGGAEIFLKSLEQEIIPYIEDACSLVNPARILGGISLSGLFSVWASVESDKFTSIVSISGSLWFDNFVEWFKCNKVNASVKDIYITLGDRESNSRDPRLSTVGACTSSIVSCIEEQGVKVQFISVPGTHFSPVIPRLDVVMKQISRTII